MDKDLVLAMFTGAFLLLMLVIFIFSFVLISRRKKNQLILEKDIQATNFRQELLNTRLEIQEQTFKNISQEIHDNIGQALSLAKLNLNTLNSPQEQRLEDTRNLVGKAIADLRDLSRSLHGEKIAELGLLIAIKEELKIIENTGKFGTQLHVNGRPVTLPAQTEIILFRIVQEALHNAVKHSGAKSCHVEINYTENSFSLSVKDDGKGFNPEQLLAAETGIGLKNMRNRAGMIQADLKIMSTPEKGTTINVSLAHNI